MKNSIKDLATKAIKNIQVVKGGETEGDGPRRPKVINISGGTDVNP